MLARLVLLLAFAAVAVLGQTPAFVNATAADNSSSATLSTSAISLTTGNTIVVFAGFSNACGTVRGFVTDTAGNYYPQTPTVTLYVSGQAICTGAWVVTNAIGNASNVYTINWSAAITSSVIAAVQVSVSGGVLAVDVHGSAINCSSCTSVTSGNYTTTFTNEILIAVASHAAANGGSWTFDTGAGWTSAATGSPGARIAAQYKVVSSIQTTQTTTMQNATSGTLNIGIVGLGVTNPSGSKSAGPNTLAGPNKID